MLEEKPINQIENSENEENSTYPLQNISEFIIEKLCTGQDAPSLELAMELLAIRLAEGDYETVLSNSEVLAVSFPTISELHELIGLAYTGRKQFSLAMTAFKQNLLLKQEDANAHAHVANCYRELGDYDNAINEYNKAIALRPNYVEALFNIGICYLNCEKYKVALEAFSNVLKIEPNNPEALFRTIRCKTSMFDWEEMDFYKDRAQDLIENEISANPQFLISILDDPQAQKNSAISFIGRTLGVGDNNKYSVFNNKKIKLGYFLGQCDNNSLMRSAADLLKTHDRKKFEVYAYSYGPEIEEQTRSDVVSAVDVFDTVTEFSDRETALLARQDEIDIAVDLSGLNEDSRPGIFKNRAAPIQINYLGYLGTTGMTQCDYIIGDEYVIPQQDQGYYAEKVLYLPNSYHIPSQWAATKSEKVSMEYEKTKGSFVFCCYTDYRNITPDEVLSWSNILNQTENSVIWLIVDSEQAKANILKLFFARGISNERIIFSSKGTIETHLQRYQHADLFLDTFRYNGHSTASDALVSGVPVVTRSGRSFASRATGSLLKSANLDELITSTSGDYENLAIKIASNQGYYKELVEKIEKNISKGSLFDIETKVRNLEELYKQVYAENKALQPS